ncbi:MAG: hypothetical protein IT458_03815 [Planctomycetes bacterium]|nr:hypothetical protein [Planctomycetota bacterium]
MSTPTKTVLERLRALPAFMQRQIESALLGPGDAPSGSTVDRVREVRLATLVQEAEEQLRAADPGTPPDIRRNRGPTLAQDRAGGMGGLPQHLRVSSTTGATAAATAAVKAATLAERERLLREGSGPNRHHDAALPTDFDEALRAAVDHAQAARDAGADDGKVKTILGLYCRELWKRPAVRSEFGSIDELDALADFKMTGGAQPRRKRGR